MTSIDETEGQWVSVKDAAATVGVPVRSIYRWVKDNKLASRRDGARVLVALEEAGRLASSRVSLGEPPPRVDVPANGTSGGKVAKAPPAPADDGEVASRVFGLLAEGVSPVDVVQRERLAPTLVAELHRSFVALRDQGDGVTPAVAQQLATLQSGLRDLRSEVGAALRDERMLNATLSTRIVELERANHILAAAPSVASCGRCGVNLHQLCQHCVDTAAAEQH